MGRIVYDLNTAEPIWKYALGEQESEQRRIAYELGVGKITHGEYSDILAIENTEENIEKLENFVESKREIIDDFEQFMEEKIYDYHYDDEGNKHIGIPFEKTDEIEKWKEENDSDIRFYQMVEVYLDYMNSHEDKDYFEFKGEY